MSWKAIGMALFPLMHPRVRKPVEGCGGACRSEDLCHPVTCEVCKNFLVVRCINSQFQVDFGKTQPKPRCNYRLSDKPIRTCFDHFILEKLKIILWTRLFCLDFDIPYYFSKGRFMGEIEFAFVDPHTMFRLALQPVFLQHKCST